MSLADGPPCLGPVADEEDVVDVDEVGQVEQVLDQPLDLGVLDAGDRLGGQAEAVSRQPDVQEGVGERRLEDRVALLPGVARRHGQTDPPARVAQHDDVDRRQRAVPAAVRLDGPGRTLPGFAGRFQREEVAVLVVVDDLLDGAAQLQVLHHEELDGLHVEAGGRPARGFEELVDHLVGDGVGLDRPVRATAFDELEELLVLHGCSLHLAGNRTPAERPPRRSLRGAGGGPPPPRPREHPIDAGSRATLTGMRSASRCCRCSPRRACTAGTSRSPP